MTIDQIQKAMEKGGLTPRELSEFRTILSGKYSRARDAWDKQETERLRFMHEARNEYKSVAAAEVAWGATEDGEQWRYWKSQMKKAERMMSSIKLQVDVAQAEARNLM